MERLNPEQFKRYLERAITSWRVGLLHPPDSMAHIMAECYVDAFQSVYSTLYGATFDEPNDEIIGDECVSKI